MDNHSIYALVGYSLIACCLIMFFVWLWSYRIKNAGVVDIFWSYNFPVMAIILLLLAPGFEAPVGLDERRQHVGDQRFEIDLLVVSSDVGEAIVSQIQGGLALDLEAYVDARLIAADAGERDRREGGPGLSGRAQDSYPC